MVEYEYGPDTCLECHETGHWREECPNVPYTCFQCGKTRHVIAKCPDIANLQCWNCKQKGHLAAKCLGRQGNSLEEESGKTRSLGADEFERELQEACMKMQRLEAAFESMIEQRFKEQIDADTLAST